MDYPPENILFMKENGIRHFQIPIPAHKESSVIIPMERIVEALRILLDPGLHPILVHCNKGKVSYCVAESSVLSYLWIASDRMHRGLLSEDSKLDC